MEKLFYIDACIRDEQSNTKKIADAIISELKKRYLIQTVVLNESDFQPVKKDFCLKRNQGIVPDKTVELARDLANADRIVISAPFWDMSFPSILKVFLEHMSLFHVTFDSNDHACYGLCNAKKVMYITTRGMNIKTGDELEQGTPYLKALSRLWGLGPLTTIAIQNMDYDPIEINEIKIKNAIKDGLIIAKDW